MAEAESFRQWLRQMRRAHDLTQEQLADGIGYSPETIRKIEAGRRTPSRQTVGLLAQKFDVPEEDRPALVKLARTKSGLEEPDLPNLTGPQPMEAAPAPPRRPTNLPSPPTSFIGREKERARLGEMLMREGARLLTLTGPPGIGKTRLSFQVAYDLLDRLRDGAFWVPLAPVTDHSQVIATITRRLKLKEAPNQERMDLLKNYLRDKQMLLVLDNFEQVLDARPFVVELIVACPDLKVMVSSRAALNVYGEHQFLVPPLSTPDPEEPADLEAIGRCEAIQLFVQRSQAVNSNFELTEANALLVSEICRQLDGLPLGIELAAARSKVLPPQAILARLSSRLKLLTAGALDLTPRQRTLRGAIDWSYDLLSPDDRVLFRRMSVFLGATLDSVEEICRLPGEPEGQLDALEGVSSLLGQSLLRRVDDPDGEGETRFFMLWTIREYALEKLAESAEEQAVRQQHAAYFLRLAEAAEPHLRGPRPAIWLDRLEKELDNLRVALEWSRGAGNDLGAHLVARMWRFWYVRGYLSEGRRWLESARATGDTLPAHIRAKLPYAAGMLALNQADYPRATELINESLELYRQLADKRGIANSLDILGVLASQQGNYTQAKTLLIESLALRREYADKRDIAGSLNNLAHVVAAQGDYDQARSLLEDGLAILRELGDMEYTAISLNNLGHIARNQGDYARARALYEESLGIKRELGDKVGIASSLKSLCEVARHDGEHEQARRLCEQSLAICRELGEKQGIAALLSGLAHIARDRGAYSEAATLYGESLAVLRTVGDKQSVAMCLLGFAQVACGQGRPERAARLIGASEGLLEAIGATLEPADRSEYEKCVTSVRNTLGEAPFQAACATGRTMRLEEAIDEAMDTRC